MKLTGKHLTNEQLNNLLDYAENMRLPSFQTLWEQQVIVALLELKHRRAEDRAREANGSQN